MAKNLTNLTAGQLERELAQRINGLYRSQLNHQPARVNCQLSDNRLTVVIEDVVTQPEKLLNDSGDIALVEQIRLRIDEIIRPHLQELVEDILGVAVLDFLSDVTINTGRGGMIIILERAPTLRTPQAASR
ncbi:DUF2294 domain-containing protein [Pseudanabaena sp. FACHB-2040]|uniref:DUF2294 domain-containing protein n=1 Tax=Pseudanabaena sp. FACHB-2040 TaxID=2692859 RepID=UPI00168813AE|nr:DUF2294 domain-containing protein [Pseudanabaena sp. FACHB-2040]MBD2256012.1 DUF2294 domain-containing protein [Pseudanabaena sp. FACHB-2040]